MTAALEAYNDKQWRRQDCAVGAPPPHYSSLPHYVVVTSSQDWILILLGSISWNLVSNVNQFPLSGRTRISRISGCLCNYIHRMDCRLVWTRTQTSKNATLGKLDLPNELCQTCEHMHLDARNNFLLPKCLVKIFLVIDSQHLFWPLEMLHRVSGLAGLFMTT